MSRLTRDVRRARNALHRVRVGLPVRGESISPDIHNDHFVCHLSLYHFIAPLVRHERVLDVGCGAGYGARYLADHGAAEVVGVDVDPKHIRFARRRYAEPGRVSYREADAQALPADLGTFGAIVSSNVFEHLEDLDSAFEQVLAHLRPGGHFVLAVPPIVDEASLAEHQAIDYHRSNLTIAQWRSHLEARFADVSPKQHRLLAGRRLDLTDPAPGALTPEDFWFGDAPPGEGRYRTITALFTCRAPA